VLYSAALYYSAARFSLTDLQTRSNNTALGPRTTANAKLASWTKPNQNQQYHYYCTIPGPQPRSIAVASAANRDS
jgi:hypothetical protein